MLNYGVIVIGLLSIAALPPSSAGSKCSRKSSDRHMLCYYLGDTPISKINVANCTHLIFTNAVVADGKNASLRVHDRIQKDLASVKESNSNLLTLFTVELKSNESSVLLNSETKSKRLVDEITTLLQEFQFDGVELDVRFGKEGNSNSSSSNGGSKSSFTSFVKVLSKSLEAQRRRTKRAENDDDDDDGDFSTTTGYSTTAESDTVTATESMETTTTKLNETDEETDRPNDEAEEYTTTLMMTTEMETETQTEVGTTEAETESSYESTEAETEQEISADDKGSNEEEEKEEDENCENKFLLVVRLPVQLETVGKKFDLKSLSRYADILSVPTHNIVNKNEDGFTYHPSRLMGLSDVLNTDSVLDFLLGMGAVKSKMVISLPASVLKFQLKDGEKNTPRSPAVGDPKRLDQSELCWLFKNGNWTLERDEDLTAPYAYSGNTWLAFEDAISVNIKGKYILLRELAGGAIYPIDDDVNDEKCTNRTGTGGYLTGILRENFENLGRKPRALVLENLHEEIHDAAYTNFEAGVKVSEYRIVRVVDHSGAVHVIRRNTKTQFECSRQGYFSHPLGCNKFYRCVKFDQYSDEYTVFEYDCPAGLAFDERWEVCVWPGSLPNGAPCTGSSEIAPVPRSHYSCPRTEGFYGDPENCRWFFACLDHARDGVTPLTAYEFRCPFGLVFNENTLACDWPWLVGSCGGRGASGYVAQSSGTHFKTFVNGGQLDSSYGQYDGKTAFDSFGKGSGGFGLNGFDGFYGSKEGSQLGAAGYISSPFDDTNRNRGSFASVPDYQVSGGRIANTDGVVLKEAVNFAGGHGSLTGSFNGAFDGTAAYESSRQSGNGQYNTRLSTLQKTAESYHTGNGGVLTVGQGTAAPYQPVPTAAPTAESVSYVSLNSDNSVPSSGGLLNVQQSLSGYSNTGGSYQQQQQQSNFYSGSQQSTSNGYVAGENRQNQVYYGQGQGFTGQQAQGGSTQNQQSTYSVSGDRQQKSHVYFTQVEDNKSKSVYYGDGKYTASGANQGGNQGSGFVSGEQGTTAGVYKTNTFNKQSTAGQQSGYQSLGGSQGLYHSSQGVTQSPTYLSSPSGLPSFGTTVAPLDHNSVTSSYNSQDSSQSNLNQNKNAQGHVSFVTGHGFFQNSQSSNNGDGSASVSGSHSGFRATSPHYQTDFSASPTPVPGVSYTTVSSGNFQDVTVGSVTSGKPQVVHPSTTAENSGFGQSHSSFGHANTQLNLQVSDFKPLPPKEINSNFDSFFGSTGFQNSGNDGESSVVLVNQGLGGSADTTTKFTFQSEGKFNQTGLFNNVPIVVSGFPGGVSSGKSQSSGRVGQYKFPDFVPLRPTTSVSSFQFGQSESKEQNGNVFGQQQVVNGPLTTTTFTQQTYDGQVNGNRPVSNVNFGGFGESKFGQSSYTQSSVNSNVDSYASVPQVLNQQSVNQQYVYSGSNEQSGTQFSSSRPLGSTQATLSYSGVANGGGQEPRLFTPAGGKQITEVSIEPQEIVKVGTITSTEYDNKAPTPQSTASGSFESVSGVSQYNSVSFKSTTAQSSGPSTVSPVFPAVSVSTPSPFSHAYTPSSQQNTQSSFNAFPSTAFDLKTDLKYQSGVFGSSSSSGGHLGLSTPLPPSGSSADLGLSTPRPSVSSGHLGPSTPSVLSGSTTHFGLSTPSGPSGHLGLSTPSAPSGQSGHLGLSTPSAPSGPSGHVGLSTPSAPSGPSGHFDLSSPSGPSGPSGHFGLTAPSAPSGPSGDLGLSAPSGSSGGHFGLSTPSGPSGHLGLSTPSAPSGSSGYLGLSTPRPSVSSAHLGVSTPSTPSGHVKLSTPGPFVSSGHLGSSTPSVLSGSTAHLGLSTPTESPDYHSFGNSVQSVTFGSSDTFSGVNSVSHVTQAPSQGNAFGHGQTVSTVTSFKAPLPTQPTTFSTAFQSNDVQQQVVHVTPKPVQLPDLYVNSENKEVFRNENVNGFVSLHTDTHGTQQTFKPLSPADTFPLKTEFSSQQPGNVVVVGDKLHSTGETVSTLLEQPEQQSVRYFHSTTKLDVLSPSTTAQTYTPQSPKGFSLTTSGESDQSNSQTFHTNIGGSTFGRDHQQQVVYQQTAFGASHVAAGAGAGTSESSNSYIPPDTETSFIQFNSEKVNGGSNVRPALSNTYYSTTSQPGVTPSPFTKNVFTHVESQNRTAENSYAVEYKTLINPKITIPLPPREYLLDNNVPVTGFGSKGSTTFQSEFSSGFKSSGYVSASGADQNDRQVNYQSQSFGSQGNDNDGGSYDGYSGRFVNYHGQTFGSKLVEGAGSGSFGSGQSSGRYDVTTAKPRERQYHGSLVSNLPATNKYEEYEIEGRLDYTKNGGSSSKTTLDLKNLKTDKNKKTVIVVSQVSEADPVLIGKLAGQCSCQSNLVQLKNKGDRTDSDKSRDGKYDTRPSQGFPATARNDQTLGTVGLSTSSYTEDTSYTVEGTSGKYLPPTPEYPETDVVSSNDFAAPNDLQPIGEKSAGRKKPFRGKARYLPPSASGYPDALGVEESRTRNEIDGRPSKSYAGAAFDRYGPGGWRSFDETLQGSVDCKRPGLFRHPKYCNKFYACHYDPWEEKFTLHVFNCPIRLTYDSSISACNWPVGGPACANDNLLV